MRATGHKHLVGATGSPPPPQEGTPRCSTRWHSPGVRGTECPESSCGTWVPSSGTLLWHALPVNLGATGGLPKKLLLGLGKARAREAREAGRSDLRPLCTQVGVPEFPIAGLHHILFQPEQAVLAPLCPHFPVMNPSHNYHRGFWAPPSLGISAFCWRGFSIMSDRALMISRCGALTIKIH